MKKRVVKGKNIESLLNRISNNNINQFSIEEKTILNDLISKGLVAKYDGTYFLTIYGEMVKVMGYKIHLQTEQFEKKLSLHTPKKKQLIALAIVLIFLIILCLLILVIYAVEVF